MRTFLTILGIAGGVVLLVLLAVAIAVSTIDLNAFVDPILARIRIATGRDVTVGGRIEFKLGLEPKLVVNDVRVGNAPWAKAPDMLSAKSVEAQVALLPLLQRRFDLLRLNLVEPVIALETDGHGHGNWEAGAAPGGAGAPDAGSGASSLGVHDLAVTHGQLTYRDGATGAETLVAIDELSLRARDAQSPVVAEFRGTVDGVAVALTGTLGPLATLADRRLPYPVAVQGEVAGRKSTAAAKVRRAEGVVELQDIDVTSGASSVKGRVEVRHGGPQATWTVDLTSASLALDDLPLPKAAAQAPQRAAAGAAGSQGRMFDDTALPFDALRKTNAGGQMTIDRLTLTDGRRLDQVRVQFTLRDAKLDAPLVQASAFGGTLNGALKIDATPGRPPAVALRLDGHALDLGAVLAASGVKREVRGGKTEVAVDVTMHGDSPRQWMSGVSGRARAVVGPATLVNAKLDPASSFDRLAEVVNPFRSGSASTELLCAVIRLPLANGVATIDRTIALETKQMDVSVSGTLDFRTETLDLSIRPRIRQGIRIDISQIAELVRFRGPFSAPTVGVDAYASAAAIARIGAAASTGGLSLLGEALLGEPGLGVGCRCVCRRAGHGRARAPASAPRSAARRPPPAMISARRWSAC